MKPYQQNDAYHATDEQADGRTLNASNTSHIPHPSDASSTSNTQATFDPSTETDALTLGPKQSASSHPLTHTGAIHKARVRQMRKQSLEFAEDADLNPPYVNGLPDLGLNEPNPTQFRYRLTWLTETALRQAEPISAACCPILVAAIQNEALIRLKVCLDEIFEKPDTLRFSLDAMQTIFENTQRAMRYAGSHGSSANTDPEVLARYLRQVF